MPVGRKPALSPEIKSKMLAFIEAGTMSVKQAAGMAGVSPSTVYSWIRATKKTEEPAVEEFPNPNEDLFRRALELLENTAPTSAVEHLKDNSIEVPLANDGGNTYLDSHGFLTRHNVETFVINGTKYRWTRRVGSWPNWVKDCLVVAACFDHDFDVASRVFAEYVKAERVGSEPEAEPFESDPRVLALKSAIESCVSTSLRETAPTNEDLALTRLVEERDLLRRMVIHLLDAQAAK